jgi:hypothetical protein
MSFDEVLKADKIDKSIESEANVHDLELENQPSA